MRGISAHSNGFQTCRALHVLQIILGSVETPGGMRFKPPYPKPATAHPKPHGKVTVGAPLDGPHLGYVQGPDDLLLQDDGSPTRIDKAYTWDNPMSAHGLMHMVISNAGGVMKMLTDTDENGDYVIPNIIYSDAYSSEMVAYADLILPDTTYLERHDCISLLDRPICEADAVADAIRWPVVEPDRDVRGFQSVLCDLGARLGMPAFVNEDGSAKYKDYADYITNHIRRPGVGPLAGFRLGENAELQGGRGEVNEAQIDNYIANGGFWMEHVPEDAAYFKPFNASYQDWPEHLRERLKETMDPLPIWYAPFEDAHVDTDEFPIHALTQRPMAMYHSWGTQNAWLRQIHGHNPLYLPTKVWEEHGFTEGDWAKVSSAHGHIVVPVAHQARLRGRPHGSTCA